MSFSEGLTIVDSWRALHQAKVNGWIDFEKEEVGIDRCIDMQEYQHYVHRTESYMLLFYLG